MYIRDASVIREISKQNKSYFNLFARNIMAKC